VSSSYHPMADGFVVFGRQSHDKRRLGQGGEEEGHRRGGVVGTSSEEVSSWSRERGERRESTSLVSR